MPKDLQNVWIVIKTRYPYDTPLTLAFEIRNQGIGTVAAGTLLAPHAPHLPKVGYTNGNGTITVESVTPADIFLGVDEAQSDEPFQPETVFVMGASNGEGPLVMASVLDWPMEITLQMGMEPISLASVGGVTPERDEGPPGKPRTPQAFN